MSNIYILEPPTSGKVLLNTTVGDIDIELWSKETPKTCRNFIQLCLEGYYDNTFFHRIVKDFIAQVGDPTGNGTGGESIYGEPFKDEFHQRLRFTRRGLVAMANAGKDDNGSQFFFTLGPTPELQNKHTLFGKVTGETIFNVLKLQEGHIEDEIPLYPHKILKTEVLNNPFPDIEHRIKTVEIKEKPKKENIIGVKNFKLLSFGEEAEEDEEESSKQNEKFLGKGKSSHDILNDPQLSSKTEEPSNKEENIDPKEQLENIKKKLKTAHKKKDTFAKAPLNIEGGGDNEIEEYHLYKDRDLERKKKMENIKKEIQNVKKDYQLNKLKKVETTVEQQKQEKVSEVFKDYKDEYDRYKSKKDLLPKKGAGREQFTLDLLAKFKKKLQDVKENGEEEEETDVENEKSWLSHKLKFEEKNPVLAKDANTKEDDWFEIYDPRNPLNKRRRGEQTVKTKK